MAVGAVISDGKGRVLLLRRRQSPFMGGRYEIPGGVVEEGEDLFQALKREVREETGLEVRAVACHLGSHDFLSRRGLRMRRHDFAVLAEGIVRVCPKEHDRHQWSAPASERNVTENTRVALSAYMRTSASS